MNRYLALALALTATPPASAGGDVCPLQAAHTGLYAPLEADAEGEGLQLVVMPDRSGYAVLTWYGYDVTGAPTWLIAQDPTPTPDGSHRFSVWQAGKFGPIGSVKVSRVGYAWLATASCTELLLEVDAPEALGILPSFSRTWGLLTSPVLEPCPPVDFSPPRAGC